MKNIKKILSAIFSFISLWVFLGITETMNNTYFISSILIILIYIVFYKIIDKYLWNEKLTIRGNVFVTIWAVLFSFTLVVGYNLTAFDCSYLERISTYGSIIGILPILISLGKYFICNIDTWLQKLKEIKFKKIDSFLFEKHTFLKSTILILLAWLPIFLAFYPGIFSYDSSVQLNEYVTGGFSNGNPIIQTLIVGFFVTTGKSLFGSYNSGVALYSVFQMIIFAFSFAFIIRYLTKKKVPPLFKYFTLLLFMFLPTFSIMATVTTKDVFYAAVTNFLLPFLIDMVIDSKSFFKNKKNILITIILFLILFICRHNGYYSFLAFFVFALLGLRKYWKQILIIGLVCIGSYKAYLHEVDKILNVGSPSAAGAMLSVPIQQIGRLYRANVYLTDYERYMLDNLVVDDAYSRYESHKSDSISFYFRGYLVYDHLREYLSIYAHLGMRYPIIFIDAFLANTMGYWYLGDKLPDQGTYRTYVETRTRDDLHNTNDEIKFDSKIPWLFDIYYDIGEHASYQSIPLLSTLMSVPFYILTLLTLSLYILYKKEYRKVIPLSLFYGLLVTLFLGPVALLRYSLSIVTTMSCVVYLAFCPIKKDSVS